MPRYNRYYPNYEQIYSSVEVKPEVMRVLRSSDRKMRYMEQQLKASRFVVDQKSGIAQFFPGRESSLEYMAEENHQPVVDERPGPEEQFLHSERLRQLWITLEGLTDAERKLIHALYFEQMSERQFSQIVGVSQQAINYRKRKILSKLRRVLEFYFSRFFFRPSQRTQYGGRPLSKEEGNSGPNSV